MSAVQRRRVIALGLVLASGCAGRATLPPAPPDRVVELRKQLVPTEEMGEGFTLRQQLRFRASAPEGEQRAGGFQTVVQLDCGELVVLALSPLGTRMLTIWQRGVATEFEWAAGESLSFSPERILLDVHRSFLYPFADPPPADGWLTRRYGEDGAVQAQESWSGGRLRERRIEERFGDRSGPWVATYEGGFGSDTWPTTTRITSAVFEYTLEIGTLAHRPLACQR